MTSRSQELVLRTQGLLEELRQWTQKFLELQADLGDEKLKNFEVFDDGAMVDVGFFHRELESELDYLRKDAMRRKDQLGRVLGVKSAQLAIQDIRNKGTIRGEYATASADVKIHPVMPDRDSPEYDELMDFFGLRKEWRDRKLFALHWGHLKEYLTVLHLKGEKVPHQHLKTDESINVIYRRKSQK